MAKRIALEGIENFRDFGGYRAGHKTIASGLLYRSAQHAFASEEDLTHLKTMQLAAIIDLRRPSERQRRPSRRWSEFSSHVIEGDDEFEGEIVWEDFIRTSDHSAASFRWYLQQYYQSVPFAPRHIALFSRYFEALANADGPVLVHCAGGKDRTGIVCALTHKLLGVHHDDIMADFLATNDHVRHDLVGPAWARDIGEETGREPPLENLAVATRVEAQYLETAFAAMNAQFGSVDKYLSGPLGVNAPRRSAIERRLLV